MANIRAMTRSEQRELVEMAAAEGWNPGRHDAELFWNLDPEGFLAVELEGKVAGGGAIIRHNDQFGFMGLFIVRPEFRGQHLGRQLWYARRDQLRGRLGPGGTIGLDAVDQMIPFYEEGGFRQWTRHRRFQMLQPSLERTVQPKIVPAATLDFRQILELDRQCFPGSRDRFLKDWMQQSEAVAMAYVEAGMLQGFGVLRPCQVGCRIGPLFAESPQVAEELFLAFQQQAGEGPLFLDVPHNNPPAVAMCQRYGMQEVFGCVRMYLGPVPPLSDAKIFATTTLEVG